MADSLSFVPTLLREFALYKPIMLQALTLLTMALQLLTLASGPNVPESLKQQAVSVANFAIQTANKVITESVSPKTVIPPRFIPPSPKVFTKELRIKPDTTEIWASGKHFVKFNFEYLVDGIPKETIISVKNIIPSEPMPPAWQGIRMDRPFIYSTKVIGNHTFRFTALDGGEGDITIFAKEWVEKNPEIIPIKTSNTYLVPIDDPQAGPHPLILLGSFKIKANPDSQIKLFSCNLVGDKNFDYFQFTEAIESKNCTSDYIRTDNEGLTFPINLSVFGLKSSYGQVRFYLKNLEILELSKEINFIATTSLTFKLDIEPR